VTRYVSTRLPWSRYEAERDFAESLEHWREHGFGKRSLVAKASGDWRGFVELCHVGPRAVEVPGEIEIGWWIDPEAWGRGFATEGARAIRDEAFERVGLERIIARYRPANVAFGRVVQKLRLTFERDAVGRHGDVVRIHALERDGWASLRDG
jgi:RimJ/RimL family protein N-acetyltransferase